VVKIFNGINKTIKEKDIRYQSHKDETPGEVILQLSGKMIRKHVETAVAYHEEATRVTCAAALQHSDDMATTHYRVGTSEVAIYQSLF